MADEHVEQVAGLLKTLLSKSGVRVLRRALKEPTPKDMDAFMRESERRFRQLWLREHPGRTAAEYNRLLQNNDSEVWEWRRAKGRAADEAEARAWERDHPGQDYPEHECSLTDREYTDLARWRRQRQRQINVRS
jgi:hypothetical protein